MFPTMLPSVDSNGNLRDSVTARQVLMDTCYQCHPGRRTDCLRGAMANGGMLCQDCHGDMDQVGDDFSRNVSPTNPGAFELAGDFYTNPATPRVPWANEPGCGSCHTGDAVDNMHGDADTLGDPEDGIRLMHAGLVMVETERVPPCPAWLRTESSSAIKGRPSVPMVTAFYSRMIMRSGVRSATIMSYSCSGGRPLLGSLPPRHLHIPVRRKCRLDKRSVIRQAIKLVGLC